MEAELNAVVIRPLVVEDHNGVLHCLASAFEPYRAAYTPQAFTDTILSPELLAARVEQMHVIVASTPEEIVGTIAGSFHGSVGHLRGMAVRAEWQGTGLAARLLAAIEAWLKAKGCATVTLDTTLPLQKAMKFYEKHGYTRSGKTADFFGMPLVEYAKRL